MYYTDEIIEEIRQKNDIVDVISSYVSIKKRGSNYVGLCPFHSEKTPSFSVSQSKQMFKCFGCGIGGNVFSFIMEYENASFPEAVKILAERAGVELPEEKFSEAAKKEQGKRKRLLDMHKDAATYFYYQLRKPNGEAGLRYFKERQLSEETMKHFGLGYANVNSNDLTIYLRSKGYKDAEISEGGLAVFSEKDGMNDKFWNRVMFPIQDANHRVIAFGGRVLGEGLPKYLNSQDTPIFDKSRNLYGLNFARAARKNRLILCEGYMDVIALHQAGFTEAVASLGTSLTEGHANLIKRFTDVVYLSYDSDGAGKKAAMRAIGILRKYKLIAKVIHLEPYKDPDEFIKNLGTEEFEKRLEKAEPAFDFELRYLEDGRDINDPDEKERFRKVLLEYIYPFKFYYDDISPYLEKISRKYLFNIDMLRQSMDRYSYELQQTGKDIRIMQQSAPEERAAKESRMRKDSAPMRNERILLTWLADRPDAFDNVRPYLTVEDFTEGVHRDAAKLLFDAFEHGEQPKPSKLTLILQTDETYDENDQQEISRLFSTRLNDALLLIEHSKEDRLIEIVPDQASAIGDVLISVKQENLKRFQETGAQDPKYLDILMQKKKEIEVLKKKRKAF
ncbi:MAG: DNA primase [Lachnospiraceae bacterium]|nr:DNA primase [Lachnospiraceae bacterium]